MYKKRHSSFKFVITCALLGLFHVAALATNYPDAITDYSGGASYCQDDPAGNLSLTYSTCRTGNNQPSNITVTWYSNTTNSTTGGTQVAQTNSNTLTTTFTYTPSTSAIGTLYYYVEITWTSSGDPACGDAGLLVTSIQSVVVDPSSPAQPGPITAGTPSPVPATTSGLTYSISSVINATSYSWTVPSGWSLDSGDGTTSISTTSGTTGGDITVTADNSCGSSTPQTLAVTIAADPPTINLGANPSVAEGSTSADLTYSATTNSPDQYSINYNATAEGEGFVDVNLAALPASPIVLVVPGSAAPATYNAILTVTNSSTSQTSGDYPLTVTITAGTPTITITDAHPSVVQGETTADIPYSGTTYSPDQYSIDYNALAESEGFVDVTNASLPASPIVLTVPGAAATATYSGILTVRNSGTGEVSQNYPITITVTSAPSPPTITLTNPNPSVVEGSTSADLTYSITTNSPDQYSIDYDATAEGEGFVDVSLAALPASPIALTVPGAASPATYNATLTVTNSGTGLTSSDYSVTVTITPGTPTITITDANPSVVQGVTTADLPYSGTTYNPDQYSIDYNALAESEGFVDVTNAALPASPIVLTVPGSAGTGTYSGILTVRNSGTGEVSTNYPITISVTSSASPPTITLGTDPTVCQGTTSVDLSYTSTTNSPDQYSIDYDATAEGEGFADVVNASLPTSPINLVVPGGANSGTYNGILTVRNSGTGLSSVNYAVTVTVIAIPTQPLAILGSTSVPELTSGLGYSIVEVSGATSYTWTVPTGWSITSGQGSSSIQVTSGASGEDGNITVTASNSCGTSAAQTLAVITYTPADHSIYSCNACHITHDALGGSLTNTFGNSNLCLSCHVTSGAATNKPFDNADKAIPGTSGTSHSWDVPSVNISYETVLTSDPEMLLRIDADNNDNITCSTCHNQHNSNTNPSYTRISNAGDFMCKDCHSPRNVGRYADDNLNHKGSHPVGLAYPVSDDYSSTPTGAVQIVGGNVECSSCHQTHYATTTDGYLLRQTNDNDLCTSCHTLFSGGGTPVGTHNGMSCKDCHQTHNTDKTNIYMIRNTISTPSSGDRTVLFTTQTGTNSFADGDATYDGVCEVCHTTTIHFRNDGSASDQNHNSSGGPHDGSNCMSCHPHNQNFAPQGCDDCHNTDAPTFGSVVHVKHKDTYGYTCSTCHFGFGSGGASEGSHPSGTINVAFDPNGLATRNGQDAITPVMNGDETCDNVYCHSDGRSAYRGTDGTYTWSSTTGPQAAVYATTPAWGSGTITTCIPCHSGTGNMTDPYTITTPGLADPLPPSTGSHRRGAHVSNSQELSGNGWDVVNCFWCHNAVDGDDGSPILQGTYGTSFHVDGSTYFDPRSVVDGGTTVNNSSGGSFSYSLLGSSAHCGSGKSCW